MSDPRYEILRSAMWKIAWPLRGLEEIAKDQGRQLDGHMAVRIANDPHYLIKLAQDAMAEIAKIDPKGVNDLPTSALRQGNHGSA